MGDPWTNQDGDVAHPRSPLGGGGTGNSAACGPLGCHMEPYDPLPHPDAPAVRFMEPPAPRPTQFPQPAAPLARIKAGSSIRNRKHANSTGSARPELRLALHGTRKLSKVVREEMI